MSQPFFIAGCGYIGGLLVRLAGNRKIAALARSQDSVAHLRALGVTPHTGDLDQPGSLPSLPLAGRVLYYFAPPPAQGRDDPRLCALLDVAGKDNLPTRVVLISTTGVYGDCNGAWVDETWPVDSNLIIYATQPAYAKLRDWLVEHATHYSAISRLETLGYQRLGNAKKQAR